MATPDSVLNSYLERDQTRSLSSDPDGVLDSFLSGPSPKPASMTKAEAGSQLDRLSGTTNSGTVPKRSVPRGRNAFVTDPTPVAFRPQNLEKPPAKLNAEAELNRAGAAAPVNPPAAMNWNRAVPEGTRLMLEGKYGFTPEEYEKYTGRNIGERAYEGTEPIRQVEWGVSDLVTGNDPEGRGRAASNVVRGAMGIAMQPEAMAPAFIGAPVATSAGIAAGMGAQYATEKGLNALGVPPGYSALGSDVAALVAGGAVGAKLGHAQSSPEARTYESVKIAPSSESQPLAPTRQQPPPSPRLNQEQRRATVEPPSSGVPENVLRAQDARERLAQELEGRSFVDLSNSQRIAIDDLVAQGYGRSAAENLPAQEPPAVAKPVPTPTNTARKQRVSPPAPAIQAAPAETVLDDYLARQPEAPNTAAAQSTQPHVTAEAPPSTNAVLDSFLEDSSTTPEAQGVESAHGSTRSTDAPDGRQEGVLARGIGQGREAQANVRPSRSAVSGNATAIEIPGEQYTYPARYQVRELAEVQASHNPFTFERNAEYAHQNDRNYNDPANQERILINSAPGAFKPSRVLTDNPTSTNGPSIIDENGNVLGGNNRAMLLARVYQNDPVTATAYREMLAGKAAQFGIDPESVVRMDRPVLLREVPNEALVDGVQRAITDMNKSEVSAHTASERATTDARSLDQPALDYLQGVIENAGPQATLNEALSGQRGAQIVNALVDHGVFTPQEKPLLIDAQSGALTPAAKERISKMMLGRLFRDSEQYQSTAPELRNKLERIVSPLAQVQGREGWDLTPRLQEAIDLLENARAHGSKNLNDVLAQHGMFASQNYSPEAIQIAGTLRQSPLAAAKAFRQYAHEASFSRPGAPASFFEPPTAHDAFRAAFHERSGERGGIDPHLLTLGMDEFVRQDVRPALQSAAESLATLWDAAKKTANPAARGNAAKQTALTLREHLADKQRQYDIASKAMEPAYGAFARTAFKAGRGDVASRAAVLDFYDRAEKGQAQVTPELDKIATVFRNLLDQRRTAIQALGTGKLQDYIQNYLPHVYKDPARAQAVLTQLAGERVARAPMEGSKSFLKQRSIEYLKDAVEQHGLEPLSWNPVDMVSQRLVQMDKFIMAQRVLGELKDAGIVKFVSAGQRAPDGYARIDDKIATVYGKPTVTVKEAFDQQVMDRLNGLADSLGIEHERKPNIGGRRWGYAQGDSKVVTKFGGPESVLAHEIGHALDARYDLTGRMKGTPGAAKELRALADLRFEGQQPPASYRNYVRQAPEKMANAITALVYAPEKFKSVAPITWNALRDELWHIPELKPLFDIKPSLVLGTGSAEIPVGGMVIRGQYYAIEPGARVINNHLSPGLRGNELVGPLYRSLFGAANWMNQFTLGLSGFHAGFTSFEANTSQLALAIYQGMRGQFGQSARSLAEWAPQASFLTNALRGRKGFAEWDAPGSQTTEVGQLIDVLKSGGFRAHLDAAYQTNMRARMAQAWAAGNPWGAAVRAVPAAVEQISSWTMEKLVPYQKTGVAMKLMESEMRRLGPNVTREQLREVAARISDTVDNRLGQLPYDNLFWNRTFKDLAQISVRSVGWNLGTYRELGGGVLDFAKAGAAVMMGKTPEATYKMSYLLALPVQTALYGGIFTYLATGQGPRDLMDYFFPRTGNLDEHGNPERFNMWGYVKDMVHTYKDPGQTIANKLNPIWSTFAQMATNRDFYGTKIRNEDDPAVQQAQQLATHIGKALVPFSVQGLMRERQLGGDWKRQALPFIGLTPASPRLNQTDAEALASKYSAAHQERGGRTQSQAAHSKAESEIVRAIRLGGNARQLEADAIKRGDVSPRDIPQLVRRSRQSPLQGQVSHLSASESLNVYLAGNPQERQQLLPVAKRKVLLAATKPYQLSPRDLQQARAAGLLKAVPASSSPTSSISANGMPPMPPIAGPRGSDMPRMPR